MLPKNSGVQYALIAFANASDYLQKKKSLHFSFNIADQFLGKSQSMTASQMKAFLGNPKPISPLARAATA